MSTHSDTQDKQKPKVEKLQVTVTFPLAGKGAFHERAEASAPVESVRLEAMGHFGLADDQTTTFYLTYKGDRVDGLTTIGQLAGKKDDSIKFTLAKELIQG